MKKLMLVLAAAGLVAGCASNQNAGGTSDQSEMNSGTSSQPFTPKQGAGSGNTYDATNTVQNPEAGQP
ncbi:MAG TPA: hypothetical protein VH597_13510 [Verrucomicrobiae bacterium]|jgi:hypothetical protein|nr:hypothetical protein [Verrucomicrobiae bacterium]